MDLTQADVKARLAYDSKTGEFRWLETGQVAGKPDGKSYLKISLKGKSYFAHRLVFLYMYGAWPRDEVDHVNGQPWDNRLINLRPATRAQNCWNVGPRLTDGRRFKGVYFDKKAQRWKAQIQANGIKYTIPGVYRTEHEAAQAYRAFSLVLHGQFHRTSKVNSPRPNMHEPIKDDAKD